MSVTTQTLVQPSATIVTILTLKPHDVYKRFDKPTYSETVTLRYGVVMSVDHNGTDAMIVALEFNPLSSAAPEMKIWATNSELKIFAADPEEIIAGMSELKERMRHEVDQARAALTTKLELQAQVDVLLERQSIKALNRPAIVGDENSSVVVGTISPSDE